MVAIVPKIHPTMPSFTLLKNNDSIVNKVVFCNLKQYICTFWLNGILMTQIMQYGKIEYKLLLGWWR